MPLSKARNCRGAQKDVLEQSRNDLDWNCNRSPNDQPLVFFPERFVIACHQQSARDDFHTQETNGRLQEERGNGRKRRWSSRRCDDDCTEYGLDVNRLNMKTYIPTPQHFDNPSRSILAARDAAACVTSQSEPYFKLPENVAVSLGFQFYHCCLRSPALS
jgi:hypothetical protein